MDNDNHFVGFQRTIHNRTEYIPAGADQWQLAPIPHNEDFSRKIDVPPSNVVSMKRARLR